MESEYRLMAYSLTLKRSRNKGLNFKTTNRVEIDDGRVDSKAKTPVQNYYEKYMTMARESMAMGDRIAAESCYQHAEHYLRLMNESKSMTPNADLANNEENTQDKLLPLDNESLIVSTVNGMGVFARDRTLAE